MIKWDSEMVCPVCGKEFIRPPETVYRLVVKGKTNYYCSYTCFRTVQRKLEAGKRYKKR